MKGYWDCDFYQIVKYGNEKYIQIDGYFYDQGEGGYDKEGNWNEDYCFRCVEFSNVEFPLQEFIDKFVNGEEDYMDTTLYDSRKEWMEDCTEEKAIDYMKHYYNGNPPIPLQYSELSMDSPCGDYVNAKEVIEYEY